MSSKLIVNIIMKRLYRSEKEQMLGGVCGGIAEYFDIDPTIIRIFFVLVVFPTVGFGFITYLLLWAIIPTESSIDKDSEDVVKENSKEIKGKFDTFTDSLKTEKRSDRKKKVKKSSK